MSGQEQLAMLMVMVGGLYAMMLPGGWLLLCIAYWIEAFGS